MFQFRRALGLVPHHVLLASAMAISLGACGGGGGSPGAAPLPPTGGRVLSLRLTLDGIRVGMVTSSQAGATATSIATPDVLVEVTGIDGLGNPIQARAGAMVAPDGTVVLEVPSIARGTDAAIDISLHNGYVIGEGLTHLKGAEVVREGENVVRFGESGTDVFARAVALEATVMTADGAGHAAEEATQRQNPEPIGSGGLMPGIHDAVREGANALLVTDLSTTSWSIVRTQADKDAYDIEAGYLKGLIAGLGFAVVDVTDDVAASPMPLDSYDLIVIDAYNRETNKDKVSLIRGWMERRRGGLVLCSGVASLLSLKYANGGDIISAGGNTTYDLTPAAPIMGFDRYRNAGGDGITALVDDLWRMAAFPGANHWAGASLDPTSAIASSASVVADYTSGGVDNGAPWASVYELAGQPSATDPGAVNTSNARTVWLASEPSYLTPTIEKEGLEVMLRGACLWAVGAVGNLNGGSGPSWVSAVAPQSVRAVAGPAHELRARVELR